MNNIYIQRTEKTSTEMNSAKQDKNKYIRETKSSNKGEFESILRQKWNEQGEIE